MAVVLGESVCNECCGRRRLIVDSRGIWSRCENCGFTEWEWSWGDGADYLFYLAERYNVDLKQIVEALDQAITDL